MININIVGSPNCYLSPTWCAMCKTEETQYNIFLAFSYAAWFWQSLINSFMWETTIPRSIKSLHSLILGSYSFRNDYKILWLNLTRTFIWTSWLKRKEEFLWEKRSILKFFGDHVAFFLKLYITFCSYNIISLYANWKTSITFCHNLLKRKKKTFWHN